MVPPGGSATLYGVLYQLLASVHHAVRLRIQQRGDAVLGARVVVEPPRGGGDLWIELPEHRIVEQLKARTTGRLWGLQEIVDKVLPDLYLDPMLDLLDGQTRYVFATEGRAGPEAHAFFQRLRKSNTTGPPLAGMGREDQKIFRRIASAVRKRKNVRSEPLAQTHRKLRHLLERFEIRENQTADRLAQEIDRMLLPLVDHVEDLQATRDQLCTIILRRGAGGGNEFMPEDVLREAGLHSVSLENRDELRHASRELLKREVALRRYDRTLDVRREPVWQESRRILILAGESGQGKTWQISRLAVELAKQPEGPFVILLDSQGEAERDLQKASDLLWMQARGRDRPISLARLAARWKEIHGELNQPWLVVCVDGVQSVREARALIEVFDWERWGLRLAMSVPTDVGGVLARERPEQVQLLVVRDFTLPELREYLRWHGHAWETVPNDVRDTLRRPLLARLYTVIGSSPEWVPTREYDLYQGYWLWLQDVREQSEHPEDFTRLKRLALTLLDEEPRYPWTLEQLEAAGVTDEARLRLERAGWWIRNDHGVEVWHDRLLSWVVAEAIAERASESLPDRLMTCFQSRGTRIGRILGYVPMDVLWLLSAKPENRGVVADLISQLEEDHAFQRHALYKNLIPTLGPRVVPSLIHRLRQLSDRSSHTLVNLSAEAISKVLDQAEDHQVELPPLLEDSCQAVRAVAVRVLTRHPHAGAIAPLWALLRESSQAVETSRGREGLSKRQAAFSALQACLLLNPDWLRSTIMESRPEEEPVWELAYLLANLKHPSAHAIWTSVKSGLFRKIAGHKLRPLALCIHVFGDGEEISRLESWLSTEEDEAGSYAFIGLARLHPDRALTLLGTVPLSMLSWIRGSWLPALLSKCPEDTRRILRERIMSTGSEFWRTANLYLGFEEHMDSEAVDALLDRLAFELVNCPENDVGAWERLRHPLHLLSRIHRLHLIEVFQGRVGTDLDRSLGELAASWIASPREYNLTALRSVLLKIGGEGIRRLIQAGLASPDPDRRWEGLAWGLIFPEEIAADTQHEAWSMAAAGEDRALVEELLTWEKEADNEALTDLWRLRSGKPPMTDTDLNPAIEALASGDVKRRNQGLAAVSISGRPDLLTRLPEWLEGLGEDLNELDGYAAFLVHRLAEGNPDGVRRLSQNLDPERFPGTLAELLGKTGADDLPGRLEQHLLRQARLGCFGAAEMELALSLKRFKELDSSLLRAVWKHGKKNCRWNREIFLTTVARLDSEEIHEEVWKTSLDRGFQDERSEGIAALKLLDPDAAFETTVRHLSETEKGRVEFVWLLMELDPKRAVPQLIEQAIREQQTEVLWAISRALRQAGPEVETELRARLDSPNFRVRTAAAHLAGWQGPAFLQSELQRLAESDPDRDVQWECIWALARQRKERCVLELMDAFRRAEGTTRWSYLEAILELGDPRLLVTEDDPLWLGRILTPELGSLEVHANARLKQRFDDTKRAAEQRDRKSER